MAFGVSSLASTAAAGAGAVTDAGVGAVTAGGAHPTCEGDTRRPGWRAADGWWLKEGGARKGDAGGGRGDDDDKLLVRTSAIYILSFCLVQGPL